MPFKSDAQRRFMYAKHPGIAKRWSSEYPEQGELPERVDRKKRVRRKALKELSKQK
jgi:hypothetical protein